jgi:hypothetical protein
MGRQRGGDEIQCTEDADGSALGSTCSNDLAGAGVSIGPGRWMACDGAMPLPRSDGAPYVYEWSSSGKTPASTSETKFDTASVTVPRRSA